MRAHIAGALLALVSAAVLAAPAAAEHRQFRPGVTESPEVSGADIAGMGRASVRVFRVNFSWVQIESGDFQGRLCGPASGVDYDWRRQDQIVRRASAQGVRLLPVIVGSPRYVARRSTHAPLTSNPREAAAYRCFVRAVVARYGRGGTFPAANPGARPITQWQVWNEPNLVRFSTEERGVNPREYANLVNITSREIRRTDPHATIALAGLPVLAEGLGPAKYLRRFYRARGIERRFDVVALHPYARNHRGVKGAVLRVRGMLRDVGDANRYLWITETGWATHGSGFEFLVKGTRGQARQLTKTYRMLRQNRRRWNVGTVAWFRWRDQAAPAQNRGAFDYAGLYTQAGSPKPSCRRFTRFTGGTCTRLP